MSKARTMVFNENYGEITASLNKTLKKCNVPPAYFWQLEYTYEEAGKEVDLDQIERFIKENSEDGQYIEPWPLTALDLFAA